MNRYLFEVHTVVIEKVFLPKPHSRELSPAAASHRRNKRNSQCLQCEGVVCVRTILSSQRRGGLARGELVRSRRGLSAFTRCRTFPRRRTQVQ